MRTNRLSFSYFAKIIADVLGNAWSFLLAFFLVIVWLISGPIFNYSNGWQLVINTSTTIITFLMVFIIQNTQNRDTEILNLKIDELIKAHEQADNARLDLKKLSDEELKQLEEEYKKICEEKERKKS